MNALPAAARRLIEALAPAQTRAVGGYVRAYLRREPLATVECDLATTATPDEVESRLRDAGIGTSAPGKRWGTVIAHLPEEGTFEITTLRKDTYLAGSRYPQVEWTTDWSTDAQRRDFTVNAMYLSDDGTLTDPFGGAEDLQNGIVKFVNDPAASLRQDPLRLLRFFRFCGHYGLGGLTPELSQIMVEAAPALATLSRARVKQEWDKLLKTPQSLSVQNALDNLGLTPVIQARL